MIEANEEGVQVRLPKGMEGTKGGLQGQGAEA